VRLVALCSPCSLSSCKSAKNRIVMNGQVWGPCHYFCVFFLSFFLKTTRLPQRRFSSWFPALGASKEVFTQRSFIFPFLLFFKETLLGCLKEVFNRRVGLSCSWRFSLGSLYFFFFFFSKLQQTSRTWWGGSRDSFNHHYCHDDATDELLLWIRLFVDFQPVLIDKPRDTFSIDGSYLNNDIIMVLSYHIWSQPSGHQLAFEIFVPGVIQQGPIAFLK